MMNDNSFGLGLGVSCGCMLGLAFIVFGVPILLTAGCVMCVGSVEIDPSAWNQNTTNPSDDDVGLGPIREAPVPSISLPQFEDVDRDLFEVAGEGPKSTEDFTLVSDARYTLVYEAEFVEEPSPSSLKVELLRSGSGLAGEVLVHRTVRERVTDSTRIRVPGGTYFLKIEASGCRYRLRIVETVRRLRDAAPADDPPKETEPGETPPEPAETEPAETEPGVTEPGVTEPGVTEPAETEPGVTEPAEPVGFDGQPAPKDPSESEERLTPEERESTDLESE